MHISDFFGLIQTIFKSKSAVLPSPVEKAKISYGNHKKLAREISSGCQGKILKLACWHGFCKGFLLKYTECCPPGVCQWQCLGGRVRAHHNWRYLRDTGQCFAGSLCRNQTNKESERATNALLLTAKYLYLHCFIA